MARCIPQFVSPHSDPRSQHRGESGQVLILFVLLIPVLLGMAALAIDLGTFAGERRTLQNAADAIALAAAQELPSESAAQAAAEDWAARYGYADADVVVSTTAVSVSNPNPSVRVTINQRHEFAFMAALGIDDAPVQAVATAIKTSPGGQAKVVPWAVTEATRDGAAPGDTVVLKYDAQDATTGNFGAIRLDGNGSSVYGTSLEDGSSSVVCSTSALDCADTSPVCDGAVCETETGNMVGSTRSGVDYRINNTDAHCDEFAEVFTAGADGFLLDPACNPWVDGSYSSLRVVILPVISSLCGGSCGVTVTGFSLFWLDGYASDRCTGNACEIEGRFINADATTGALVGQYDPSSSLHYARLVE